jgi:hypothetical protein
VHVRRRAVAATLIAVCAAITTQGSTAADAEVRTYVADYDVEYKGRDVGRSTLTVSYDPGADLYTFESHTEVKGLLRFVSPNPVIERSEFRIADGRIVPLRFRYEDGSRKGEDNIEAVFDWAAGTVSIESDAGRREIPLVAGALDRGSLQVAVMRDTRGGRLRDSYLLADDDSIERYDYENAGSGSATTPAGTFETVELVQTRTGSSRTTRLSLAPTLDYLPVTIEQHRNGEIQSAFRLRSVAGLAAD